MSEDRAIEGNALVDFKGRIKFRNDDEGLA